MSQATARWPRIGQGIDVHAFADDPPAARRLRLCGVDIPDGPPLDGHSDADVGAHAVADALLGALALGDLGSRFGVDDPALAGADSLTLLTAVKEDVVAAGYRLGNLDLTLVAQRPRLAAYRDAMRARLAGTLSADVGSISVTFTTTDHLGTIGRGEGIAALAVGLLVPIDG